MHFEELWEKCEKFVDEQNSLSAIDSIVPKLELYKVILSRTDIPPEDVKHLKERLLGEILFELCQISSVDNLNSFECLFNALKSRIK